MFKLCLRLLLTCLMLAPHAGCGSSETSRDQTAKRQASPQDLVGSWTSKDESRFLDITAGGSIVASEKGSPDEAIGYYRVDGGKLLISKDRDAGKKYVESVPFEMISENEIVVGENETYWNVVNAKGRWFREGVDIEAEVAKQKMKQLSPLEKRLAEYKSNRTRYIQFLSTLETDRKTQLGKLSKMTRQKDGDSWKLLANALAATLDRTKAVKSRVATYDKAIQRIELAIADQKRTEDLKELGLTDEELKELAYAIHETEDQLPTREGAASDFVLQEMIAEELERDSQAEGQDSISGKKKSEPENSP